MSYRSALLYLSELEKMGMELGLAKTQALLDALGNPHRSYPAILISGTNGKSSVASIIANVISRTNHRIGLYTSPHILVPEERIRVDGRPIPRSALASAVRELQVVVDRLLARGAIRSQPTYFELLTVLACSYFEQQQVQLGVFEVGLGGSYDATNVVDPLVSIITSIDYDHTQILGETLTEIAEEKLGIGRCGVPLVCNAMHLEVREILQRHCRRSRIPLVDAHEAARMKKLQGGWHLSTEQGDYPGIQPHLKGDHQLENIMTAVLGVEALGQDIPELTRISAESMVHAINATRLSGRLETVQRNPAILLDGAHNTAAARALARYLRSEQRNPVLLFSALADKDVEGIARELFPLAQDIIVTRIPGTPRAELPTTIRARTASIRTCSRIIESPEKALEHAISVCGERDLVLVTGSFYLVGTIKRLLQEKQQTERIHDSGDRLADREAQ